VRTGISVVETERRRLLLLVLIALIPFTLLAIWARFYSPAPWEPAVLNALALGSDPWGDAMRAVNALGSLSVWAVVVGVLAIGFGVTRGVRAGALIALSYAADLAAFGVKVVIERPRPVTPATEHFFGADSFSFPSGHVVRAVALAAVVVWLLAPVRLRLRAAVCAAIGAWLVMGYARVALGVHWPTDTVGGALLGLAWFSLTTALVARAE